MLAGVIGAGTAQALDAPLAPHAFHGAWDIEGPRTIDAFFDYPNNNGSRYLIRNLFMPGNGVEIDMFVAREKLTREGLLIRNESDLTVDVTLSGCGFIDRTADRVHFRYQTIIAVDQPPGAVLHVVLPARNFAAANLTDPNGKLQAYYKGAPQMDRVYGGAVQCQDITVTNPPP
jgi:hypothetical protein